MGLPFNIDIFSFIPALGAVGLSLKNWLELKQGAVIRPVKFTNYGLWGVKYQEKQNKGLLIPIILSNDGSKSGMVTDISIEFKGPDGTKELDIRRKVELKSIPADTMKAMNFESYRKQGLEELNPFFPIPVASNEDNSVLLDCFDRDNVIQLDKKHTCSIHVSYGNGKSSSIEFPFMLTTEEYDNSTDVIKWLRN